MVASGGGLPLVLHLLPVLGHFGTEPSAGGAQLFGCRSAKSSDLRARGCLNGLHLFILPCCVNHESGDLRVGDLLCTDDALMRVKAHGVGVGLGLRLQGVDLSSLLIMSRRYFSAGMTLRVTDGRLGLCLHCPDGEARPLLQRVLAGSDHLQWYV